MTFPTVVTLVQPDVELLKLISFHCPFLGVPVLHSNIFEFFLIHQHIQDGKNNTLRRTRFRICWM